MVSRLRNLSPRFKEILKVSLSLAGSLNFDIYMVGGVVRDLILGKEVFDLDIVVEGDAIVFASKLASQIKGGFNRHHAFGTATVCFDGHKIDFATARTEHYSHWGALPKVSPNILAEDLYRRDFTINAMAISLNKKDYGTLIDLHNGLNELNKGVIKVLHDKSFLEDPTRILRAIRFEQRFSFKIEDKTFKLMKDAISGGALKYVSLHRLRDELILILKEERAYQCIKRIKCLEGFSFINKNPKIDKESLKFFPRAASVISRYSKLIEKHEEPRVWLIYLAGMLIKLPKKEIMKIIHDFGFRKKERIVIESIKDGINRMKKLNKPVAPRVIYQELSFYKLESLLFFYAYYTEKNLRANIDCYLNELIDVRLKIQGRDLKSLGFRPLILYGKLLQKLLYVKIDKNLKTKEQEMEEAAIIFKRMREKTTLSGGKRVEN